VCESYNSNTAVDNIRMIFHTTIILCLILNLKYKKLIFCIHLKVINTNQNKLITIVSKFKHEQNHLNNYTYGDSLYA